MTTGGISGSTAAIVLAGAVAKGAFGAGVLTQLAAQPIRFRRVAGTSAGALTASVAAAGVATGKLGRAAAVVRELWLERAAWQDFAHLSWSDWLHARGVLDTSKIVRLVRDAIAEVVEGPADRDPEPAATVTLVTTSLDALPDPASPLPTYERAVVFQASDYGDPAQWSKIALAAAASATFPGVFAPTLLDGHPCVDGGGVNNTPISYVLDDPEVATVYVVTSEPPAVPAPRPLDGIALIGKIADIVINERISHDLSVASATNARLARVEEALAGTGASAETRARVLEALGWRMLDLRIIHPDAPLPGGSFTGFLERSARAEYIAAGEEAAKRVLGASS